MTFILHSSEFNISAWKSKHAIDLDPLPTTSPLCHLYQATQHANSISSCYNLHQQHILLYNFVHNLLKSWVAFQVLLFYIAVLKPGWFQRMFIHCMYTLMTMPGIWGNCDIREWMLTPCETDGYSSDTYHWMPLVTDDSQSPPTYHQVFWQSGATPNFSIGCKVCMPFSHH